MLNGLHGLHIFFLFCAAFFLSFSLSLSSYPESIWQNVCYTTMTRVCSRPVPTCSVYHEKLAISFWKCVCGRLVVYCFFLFIHSAIGYNRYDNNYMGGTSSRRFGENENEWRIIMRNHCPRTSLAIHNNWICYALLDLGI